MSLDLSDITSLFSVVFIVMAIVVYYFGRIIANASPYEHDKPDIYVKGVFFILSYLFIPFGLSLIIIHTVVLGFNNFFGIDLVHLDYFIVYMSFFAILLLLLLHFVEFLLKDGSITLGKRVVYSRKLEDKSFPLILFPAFLFCLFLYMYYYVFLMDPDIRVSIHVLFFSLLFLIAFMMYTAFAIMDGKISANYPYAKIVLLDDSIQFEGNIRKIGKDIELNTDDATYYINRDNVRFIEIKKDDE